MKVTRIYREDNWMLVQAAFESSALSLLLAGMRITKATRAFELNSKYDPGISVPLEPLC
jgi:hypothetical protein